MRVILPAILALLPCAAGAETIVVTAPLFAGSPRVADRELAAMRGGMRLPNGLDVAIGIDIQTRIDGQLALHTSYESEGPNAGVRVFTDGYDNHDNPPAGSVVVTMPGPNAPTVIVDRSPTGTTIAPGGVTRADGLAVTLTDTGWPTGAGEMQVPVVAGGPPVVTGPGAFSLTEGSAGTISKLVTATLEIDHLIGQATGVVVANTGSDRVIDTVSAVKIDVQGFSPAVLSGVFDAQRAALEAVRR